MDRKEVRTMQPFLPNCDLISGFHHNNLVTVSVADRHRFDADPDPTFYFDVDPNPDPDLAPDPYYFVKDPRKFIFIFYRVLSFECQSYLGKCVFFFFFFFYL